MKKKKLLAMLLTSSLALGLCACGKTETDQAGEGQADTAPAAEEQADTVSGKDGVTLQLLQFKEDQAAIIQAMVADYNAQSDGVTVEATILGDDYSATRQARFAGGEGPDIFL